MATTFKDFIAECELYEYSRENFEFMKECKEIEISEKFINDQLFLSEANALIENASFNLEEKFFQESVDDCSLEVLIEKTKTKSNGLLSKMINKILSIFKVFSKFFSKIANKFDDTTKKGQSVLSRINNISLDDDNIQKIINIVETAKKTDATAFPIRRKQPYASKIKLKYAGSANKDMLTLKDALAVALSDKTVIAEALWGDDNITPDLNRIGIMDPEEIYKAGVTLYMGKESEVLNIAKNLITSWTYVKRNGLTIEINTKTINKTAEQLNDICDKINKIHQDISISVSQLHGSVKLAAQYASDAVNNRSNDQDENSKSFSTSLGKILNAINEDNPKYTNIVNTINQSVSMLTSSIGCTTKVYTQLNAYRRTVTTELDSYLNTLNLTK